MLNLRYPFLTASSLWDSAIGLTRDGPVMSAWSAASGLWRSNLRLHWRPVDLPGSNPWGSSGACTSAVRHAGHWNISWTYYPNMFFLRRSKQINVIMCKGSKLIKLIKLKNIIESVWEIETWGVFQGLMNWKRPNQLTSTWVLQDKKQREIKDCLTTDPPQIKELHADLFSALT